MQQSRLESFVEIALGTTIGFVVSGISQLFIFPFYEIEKPLDVHLAIVSWFTGISLVRGYIVRRWFNAGLHKAAIKIAGKILRILRRKKMKVMDPEFSILRIDDEETIVRLLETAARNCYKSATSETIEEALDFLDRQIVQSRHHSVLEHINITIDVICDRGVSHQMVRHRIASYSQESQRFCNYSKDKHGSDIIYIRPIFWEPEVEDCVAVREYKEAQRMDWFEAMNFAQKIYMRMIARGAPSEEARCVLPNSTKTDVVMTTNLRSWRNFFQQRVAKKAHPQMRQIARPLLDEFKKRIPLIFDDITY